MSIGAKSTVVLWQEICLAVENKGNDPQTYERFFIGSIYYQLEDKIQQQKKSATCKKPPCKSIRLSAPLPEIMLTPREAQVLYLICQKLTNAQVSAKIGLSPRTVEYYIKNIRQKTLTVNKKNLILQTLKTDFMNQPEVRLLTQSNWTSAVED